MPAHRKNTVIGRSKNTDRAGNTLASYERIARLQKAALRAGLPAVCVGDWYTQGLEELFALTDSADLSRDEIEYAQELEDALRLGCEEQGIDPRNLVPRLAELHDLRFRTIENRTKVPA